MSRPSPAPPQSPTLLRFALGIVYFHFGFLKFFPDLSPAEMLATQTVMVLSQHWLDAEGALRLLAILETAIGVGLIFNILPRLTFGLFLSHMAGTFMPLFVLPELTFKIAPFAPNVEGQYIFKNIVFVAAGWTVLLPQILPRKRNADPAEAANDRTAKSSPTNIPQHAPATVRSAEAQSNKRKDKRKNAAPPPASNPGDSREARLFE